MALLDNLLGGDSESANQSSNQNSDSFDSVIGTNPDFGFGASDVLHFANESSENDGDDSESDSTHVTGIGDIGFGFGAPTVIGASSSSDQSSTEASNNQSDGDGLLGGLL